MTTQTQHATHRPEATTYELLHDIRARPNQREYIRRQIEAAKAEIAERQRQLDELNAEDRADRREVARRMVEAKVEAIVEGPSYAPRIWTLAEGSKSIRLIPAAGPHMIDERIADTFAVEFDPPPVELTAEGIRNALASPVGDDVIGSALEIAGGAR